MSERCGSVRPTVMARGPPNGTARRDKTWMGPPGASTVVTDPVQRCSMGVASTLLGLSMICDRESGRCVITSAWSTKEARDNSEQMVQPKRQRGAEIFGAQPSVDVWDIAVVHRHAPSGEGACVRCTWLSMDTATFASRDAMAASRSAAEALRSRTTQDAGATVTDIQEFDLALAHLHVREMA